MIPVLVRCEFDMFFKNASLINHLLLGCICKHSGYNDVDLEGRILAPSHAIFMVNTRSSCDNDINSLSFAVDHVW